jgi:hypothetical protein
MYNRMKVNDSVAVAYIDYIPKHVDVYVDDIHVGSVYPRGVDVRDGKAVALFAASTFGTIDPAPGMPLHQEAMFTDMNEAVTFVADYSKIRG